MGAAARAQPRGVMRGDDARDDDGARDRIARNSRRGKSHAKIVRTKISFTAAIA